VRLLVLGASGGTGTELVLQGLARGHEVRAWSLSKAELPILHRRLVHVYGDARNPELLRAAVRGVDAVLCALGSTAGLVSTDLCGSVTQKLAHAMQRERVDRVLAITSMGTTAGLGPIHTHLFDPLLLHTIYDDKRRQERILMASDLSWTIVRPGRLQNGPPSFRARSSTGERIPGLAVRRADLAAFLLEELDERRFERRAVYLAEPAPLGLHRWLSPFGPPRTRPPGW
jgi:uncharacterized protein YbjT (DUF2867 family)